MNKISVVVSAWNEQERIAKCLASVKWAQEIIVINSASTDKTAEIASKYTKKVFLQPNYPMLNRNKNFGFTKASGEWILSLDADEEITPELASEIQEQAQKEPRIAGYWIPRKNIIFGKWIRHGLWWPDKQLRLFRRNLGKFPCKHVHEYLTVDGPTAELTEPFIHHNYQSVSQFLRKLDLYTSNEVEKLVAAKYQLSWFDALRFPISDLVKIYFAQEGYLDGLHGLVLALLQSCYSLIVFTKLWERSAFSERDLSLPEITREIKHSGDEVKYWLTQVQLKQETSVFKRFWLKFLNRYVR